MVINLREAFLGKDPFIGYEPDFPLDLSWSTGIPNIDKTLFDHVFGGQHPSLIIEVGTWKGDSAITMADYVADNGTIICVDTWLGSFEMYHFPDMYRKNGYPQVYYQFLSNVVHCGKQNIIVPMPITSHLAARLLRGWKVQADAIYIDASHDYHDVKQDLEDYWPLVKKGGVLFGDDFKWTGVAKAVNEVSKSLSVEVNSFTTPADGRLYYIMEKP
jgi:hypothetical protein